MSKRERERERVCVCRERERERERERDGNREKKVKTFFGGARRTFISQRICECKKNKSQFWTRSEFESRSLGRLIRNVSRHGS